MMSGKAKIAIAAAALAVVAVSTAGVLAQGADRAARHGGKSSSARTSTTVPLTVTKTGGPVAAAKSSHNVALAFDETHKVSVPPGRSQIKVGPTQKGCRTINGYYFVPGSQHTKVISEGDSPALHRFWKFYRNNPTGKAIKGVVYGTVCIRGANLIP
jgi:hypothetical protein